MRFNYHLKTIIKVNRTRFESYSYTVFFYFTEYCVYMYFEGGNDITIIAPEKETSQGS